MIECKTLALLLHLGEAEGTLPTAVQYCSFCGCMSMDIEMSFKGVVESQGALGPIFSRSHKFFRPSGPLVIVCLTTLSSGS